MRHLCDIIGMKENNITDFEIYEIDEEEFSCSVSFDQYYLDVRGSVRLDEVENLWGDQVSSVSIMADVDEIEEVFQYDVDNGNELPYVNLELMRLAKKHVNSEMYEEVDNVHCSINYNDGLSAKY